MSGGYESTPQDAILAQIQMLWQAVNEARGANGLESATITGDTGFTTESPSTSTRVRLANAALTFWHDVVNFPTQFGRLAMSAGERSFYLYPPYAEGHRHANSLIISGRDPGTPGSAQLASDGYVRLQVKDAAGNRTGSLIGEAQTVSLAASGGMTLDAAGDLVLDATRIMPYGLDTISSTPNVVVDFPGGFPVLKLTTSSARYKQEIADAEIDAEAVLRWRPRVWRDRNAVAEQGDDAPEHIGFIAEEIHDETPEFVVLDNEGRPDSLKYDRMVAGLHAVVKSQAEQIADLTARLEALEAK